MTLPTPPDGTHWEVTGEPQGPWVWTSGTVWHHDANGFAITCELWAFASAPGATAIWVY